MTRGSLSAGGNIVAALLYLKGCVGGVAGISRTAILGAVFAAFAFGIGATTAQAQIFSDDQARADIARNVESIEALGRVMRSLREQIATMSQNQQALEQELREVTGRLEEKEEDARRTLQSADALVESLSALDGKLSAELATVTGRFDGIDERHNELAIQMSVFAVEVSLLAESMLESGQDSASLDGRIVALSIQFSSMRDQLGELVDIVEVPAEGDMYAVAFSAYQRRNFREALAGFEKILKYYPEGQFAKNARYWMSEAQLAEGKYEEALATAQELVGLGGERTPDVMLVVARAQQALGLEIERAATLNSLIELYPTSLAADRARQLLYP